MTAYLTLQEKMENIGTWKISRNVSWLCHAMAIRPLVGLAPALAHSAASGARLALTGLRKDLGDGDAAPQQRLGAAPKRQRHPEVDGQLIIYTKNTFKNAN